MVVLPIMRLYEDILELVPSSTTSNLTNTLLPSNTYYLYLIVINISQTITKALFPGPISIGECCASYSNASHLLFCYFTISKNVSGLSLLNISLHVITVTRFSVLDRLIILCVQPGII